MRSTVVTFCNMACLSCLTAERNAVVPKRVPRFAYFVNAWLLDRNRSRDMRVRIVILDEEIVGLVIEQILAAVLDQQPR